MRARIRAWLAETHGSRFELFRHFLAHFFGSDSGGSGGWLKLSLGAVGLLPLTWPILFIAWQAKYIWLLQQPKAELYRAEVRADQLWLIAVAMCITAVLTSVQWHALFPSRRDLMALAALPLTPGEIFLAKFGALATIFCGFVLALTVVPAYAFSVIVAGRWALVQNSITSSITLATSGISACAFVFFGGVALQGVLINILPGRIFDRISVYLQALLLAGSLASIPYLDRIPGPALFLDL